MTPNAIQDAINDARRFIDRAEHLLGVRVEQHTPVYLNSFPKEQGAVRRASMDLTRALAEMRRSR